MTIDLHKVTADVCTALGGTNESQSEHAMTRFAIMGGAVTLVMRTGYGATANKITINAYIVAEDSLPYHDRTRLDSITVTGTRPAEAIATEINRRLLDGIADKLAVSSRRVAARNNVKDAVKARAADWAARFPGLSIDVNNDGLSARLYFNKDGKYLNGDMLPDGSISIQRLSLDGEADAVALLSLLSGTQEESPRQR